MTSRFFLLALILPSVGCSLTMPPLGAHVHPFTHRDQSYIKCTIVASAADSHMAEQSWQVCRDSFLQQPRGGRR